MSGRTRKFPTAKIFPFLERRGSLAHRRVPLDIWGAAHQAAKGHSDRPLATDALTGAAAHTAEAVRRILPELLKLRRYESAR